MMTIEAIEQTAEQRVRELENQLYAIHINQKFKPHDEKIKMISLAEYADAVITLFNLVDMRCGGSYYAAQVLLSLYNGNEFHVDLARVACNLDAKHLDAALVAIKARGLLMREPHEVIKDGDHHFDELWGYWKNDLHVSKRYGNHYRR